jgi:hypothetical protein
MRRGVAAPIFCTLKNGLDRSNSFALPAAVWRRQGTNCVAPVATAFLSQVMPAYGERSGPAMSAFEPL